MNQRLRLLSLLVISLVFQVFAFIEMETHLQLLLDNSILAHNAIFSAIIKHRFMVSSFDEAWTIDGPGLEILVDHVTKNAQRCKYCAYNNNVSICETEWLKGGAPFSANFPNRMTLFLRPAMSNLNLYLQCEIQAREGEYLNYLSSVPVDGSVRELSLNNPSGSSINITVKWTDLTSPKSSANWGRKNAQAIGPNYDSFYNNLPWIVRFQSENGFSLGQADTLKLVLSSSSLSIEIFQTPGADVSPTSITASSLEIQCFRTSNPTQKWIGTFRFQSFTAQNSPVQVHENEISLSPDRPTVVDRVDLFELECVTKAQLSDSIYIETIVFHQYLNQVGFFQVLSQTNNMLVSGLVRNTGASTVTYDQDHMVSYFVSSQGSTNPSHPTPFSLKMNASPTETASSRLLFQITSSMPFEVMKDSKFVFDATPYFRPSTGLLNAYAIDPSMSVGHFYIFDRAFPRNNWEISEQAMNHHPADRILPAKMSFSSTGLLLGFHELCSTPHLFSSGKLKGDRKVFQDYNVSSLWGTKIQVIDILFVPFSPNFSPTTVHVHGGNGFLPSLMAYEKNLLTRSSQDMVKYSYNFSNREEGKYYYTSSKKHDLVDIAQSFHQPTYGSPTYQGKQLSPMKNVIVSLNNERDINVKFPSVYKDSISKMDVFETVIEIRNFVLFSLQQVLLEMENLDVTQSGYCITEFRRGNTLIERTSCSMSPSGNRGWILTQHSYLPVVPFPGIPYTSASITSAALETYNIVYRLRTTIPFSSILSKFIVNISSPGGTLSSSCHVEKFSKTINITPPEKNDGNIRAKFIRSSNIIDEETSIALFIDTAIGFSTSATMNLSMPDLGVYLNDGPVRCVFADGDLYDEDISIGDNFTRFNTMPNTSVSIPDLEYDDERDISTHVTPQNDIQASANSSMLQITRVNGWNTRFARKGLVILCNNFKVVKPTSLVYPLTIETHWNPTMMPGLPVQTMASFHIKVIVPRAFQKGENSPISIRVFSNDARGIRPYSTFLGNGNPDGSALFPLKRVDFFHPLTPYTLDIVIPGLLFLQLTEPVNEIVLNFDLGYISQGQSNFSCEDLLQLHTGTVPTTFNCDISHSPSLKIQLVDLTIPHTTTRDIIIRIRGYVQATMAGHNSNGNEIIDHSELLFASLAIHTASTVRTRLLSFQCVEASLKMKDIPASKYLAEFGPTAMTQISNLDFLHAVGTLEFTVPANFGKLEKGVGIAVILPEETLEEFNKDNSISIASTINCVYVVRSYVPSSQGTTIPMGLEDRKIFEHILDVPSPEMHRSEIRSFGERKYLTIYSKEDVLFPDLYSSAIYNSIPTSKLGVLFPAGRDSGSMFLRCFSSLLFHPVRTQNFPESSIIYLPLSPLDGSPLENDLLYDPMAIFHSIPTPKLTSPHFQAAIRFDPPKPNVTTKMIIDFPAIKALLCIAEVITIPFPPSFLPHENNTNQNAPFVCNFLGSLPRNSFPLHGYFKKSPVEPYFYSLILTPNIVASRMVELFEEENDVLLQTKILYPLRNRFLQCYTLHFLASAPSTMITSGANIQHVPTATKSSIFPSDFRRSGDIIATQFGDIPIQGLFSGLSSNVLFYFTKTHASIERSPTASDLGDFIFSFNHKDVTTIDMSLLDLEITLPEGYRYFKSPGLCHLSTSLLNLTEYDPTVYILPPPSYSSPSNTVTVSSIITSLGSRPSLKFSLVNMDTTFEPDMFLAVSVRCVGFGVPSVVPRRVVEEPGKLNVGFTLSYSSRVIFSSNYVSRPYTVPLSGTGNGSVPIPARFTPNFINTPSTYHLSIGTHKVGGTAFRYTIALPFGISLVGTTNNLSASLKVIRSINGSTMLLLVDNILYTPEVANVSYGKIVISAHSSTPVSSADNLEISIIGLKTPSISSHSTLLQHLSFSPVAIEGVFSDGSITDIVLRAYADTVRVAEITLQPETMTLKTILVNSYMGAFSAFFSYPINGLPTGGAQIAFSLPSQLNFVNEDAIVCGIRVHDGQELKHEMKQDDFIAQSIHLSVVTLEEDGYLATQYGRFILRVEMSSQAIQAINADPRAGFGVSVHCTGGTPAPIEFQEEDSYYIEIWKKQPPGVNPMYVPIVNGGTSRAVLLSTNAPNLAEYVQYVHGSTHSGDTNTLTINIVNLSIAIGKEDVVEAAFPSTYRYFFTKRPSQYDRGRNSESQTSHDGSNGDGGGDGGNGNGDDADANTVPYTTCEILLERGSGEEERISDDWYSISLSSSTLKRSTHVYITDKAEEDERMMTHVMSLRFKPDAPLHVFDLGSTIIWHCDHAGYPSEPTKFISFSSVSLYRSEQADIDFLGRQITVDTLLSRVAYNDNIALAFLGPQAFSNLSFLAVDTRLDTTTDIRVRLDFPRTIALSNDGMLSLSVELPNHWMLTQTSGCKVSFGSPFPHQTHIEGMLQNSGGSLVFTFVPPSRIISSSNALYLFCSNVSLPTTSHNDGSDGNDGSSEIISEMILNEIKDPLSSPLQQHHVLEIGSTATLAQLSIRLEDGNELLYCQTRNGLAPLNLLSIPPTHFHAIHTTHSFISPSPFSQAEVFTWFDAIGKAFTLDNVWEEVKIISLQWREVKSGEFVFNSSTNSKTKNLTTKSRSFYQVEIFAMIVPSQPWIDIDEKYGEITISRSSHLKQVLQTTYPIAKYEHFIEMKEFSTLCINGIYDEEESDVDCGGPFCGLCDVGKFCGRNEDCLSGRCNHSICYDISSYASKNVSIMWLAGLFTTIVLGMIFFQ